LIYQRGILENLIRRRGREFGIRGRGIKGGFGKEHPYKMEAFFLSIKEGLSEGAIVNHQRSENTGEDGAAGKGKDRNMRGEFETCHWSIV